MIGDSAIGLVLRLSAKNDASPEVKKFREDTEKELKGLEDSGTGTFSKLAKSIGLSSEQTAGLATALPIAGAAIAGLSAVAVGLGTALFGIANRAAEFGSAIFDASEKTGLGAETLSSLKLAADQSSSSLEQVTAGVTKFSRLVGEAANGSDKAAEKLKRLGVEPQDAINDLDGSLGKVFASIAALPPGVLQTSAAFDAFGKAGADLLPFIKSFDGDLPGLIAKAKQLGVVLTDEDARAADAFGDTLDTLKAQTAGIANQFAFGFVPKITSAMEELSGSLAGNKSVWRDWGENIGEIILRIERTARVSLAILKDLFSKDYGGTNTGIALRQIAEDFDREERKKAIRDNLSDPNRPDFLKQQDADIKRLGRQSLGSDFSKSNSFDVKKVGGLKKEDFQLSADGKVLVEAATRLGISPIDLASIIGYETAGTFSPKIKGGKGGNYTGLIQFGKEEYQKYNVDKNNTFEKQLLNSVVPFFKDRFASVGRETTDASLLDLYKTVNGGNPNVSSNASDGRDPKTGERNTIAGHVERILREQRPKALDKFFGGKESNIDKDSIGGELKKALQDEKRRNEERVKDEKKASEEIVKNREAADKRVLASAKQAANESKAINDNLLAQELISRDEYDKRVEQSAIDLLTKERTLLEERFALAKQNGVETIGIEQEIAAVISQIKVRQSEDETAAYLRSKKYAEDLKALRLEVAKSERDAFNFQKEQERKILQNDAEFSFGEARLTALIVLREFDIAESDRRRSRAALDAASERDNALLTIGDKEKEREKVEEINKLYENRLQIINGIHQADIDQIKKDFQPAIDGAAVGAVGGGFLDGILNGAGVSAEGLLKKVEPLKVIGDIIGGQFQKIAEGAGAAVRAFVLFGSAGGSFRKFAAEILASIAQLAIVQAVFELAQGFAALALTYFTGNPKYAASAGAHFTAAAIYGLVGGVAAVAGRLTAGDSFKQQNTGAFGAAGGGTAGGGAGGQTNQRGVTSGAYSGAGDTVTTFGSGINAPIQRHEIRVGNEKYIFDVLENSASKNGRMRELFRHLADGTT